MRRAARSAGVLLAVAAMLAPAASRADETPDPRIRIAVTRVTPSEGVTVTLAQPAVAHLAPLITLRNRTGVTIQIHDERGTPFLRIGPAGIDGNVRSPFYGPAVRPGDPPPPSPGGPEPLWQPHGTGDTVKWYDRRAAYDGHGPADRSTPATLKLFTIPGSVNGDAFAIDGAVTWHPVRGRVEAALAAVVPDADGIDVRILAGTTPAIELRNATQRTIELTGRDGLPFARIGPAGIEIDENSPTWRDTRSQPEAVPRTPAAWRTQSSLVLIWLEKRAAFDKEPPEEVQAAGRTAELSRWSVPGTIDGDPFEIRGITRWIPAADPASTPGGGESRWLAPAIVAAAAAAAGGAIAAVIRRRRHRRRHR
ncbi:MAG TPA: hypothetical protein VGB64_03610 [Actinomycetota bacterium]